MICVDTNILIYAHRRDSPFHASARHCVTQLAEGGASWAIAWPSIHEFLAIATHPRIFKPPTSLSLALAQVEAWLAAPTLTLLSESPIHWEHLKRQLENGQIVGPMVHDARIAALCVQHAVRELWSVDRDFSRFRGLRVLNPLLR